MDCLEDVEATGPDCEVGVAVMSKGKARTDIGSR